MSLAAAFMFAAAVAAQATATDAPKGADRGAEVDTARVSVTILRPAVLKDGALVSSKAPDAPHSQRHDEGGRVTYAFE
jgi:hypothetical protein